MLLIPFGIGFTLGIILNPVLTLCAVVIFGLWFASRGVNIFSGTSMKGTLVSVGMGLVGLGALIPFLFVMVYSNIKKAEEAENAV